MRKYIIIAGAVVVALLISPYFMGLMAERQIDKLAEDLSTAGNVHFKVTNYKRGWLKSYYDVNAHISPTEEGLIGPKLPPEMIFDMQGVVHHGPSIFVDGRVRVKQGYTILQQNLSETLADTLSEVIPDEEGMIAEMLSSHMDDLVLTTEIFISLNNNIDINSYFPEIEYSAGPLQLQWGGFVSHTTFSSYQENLQTKIKVGSLSLKTSQSVLEMKAFAGMIDTSKDESNLWVGEMMFNFPSFVFNVNETQKLLITQANVHSKSEVTEGLFSLLLEFELEKLSMKAQDYGPLRYVSQLRNVDAATLSEISQQVGVASAQTSSKAGQILWLSLLSKLPQLVAPGAEFDLQELHLGLPQGAVDISARIKVPESSRNGRVNLFILLAGLEAQGKLSLPTDFAENTLSTILFVQGAANFETLSSDEEILQLSEEVGDIAANQLSEWVDEGMIVLKDGDYRIDFAYKSGVLMLNGKRFSFTQLFNLGYAPAGIRKNLN